MTVINTFFNYINIEIFSNTISDYLVLIFYIFLAFPISKLVNYILQNYIMEWTSKTESKFDDVIFGSLNPSITMFIFAGMFAFGISSILGVIRPVFDKILNFLLIIPIVYFMIKFSTEMIRIYLKGNRKNKRNEAAIDLLIQIIKIILFVIGVLLILGNLGYDVSALIAGLGVGGLAFALAAQDILKNFFAGIAIIFDKTFGKKERVNFEGNSGIIESIGLRSTKLRTYDGTMLTIPNAMLSDNIVENVTKVPRVKVKMTIGLVYSTTSSQIKKAKKIIQKAIDNNEDADGDSTTIYFDNFGAYSLDIKIYYYAKTLTMNDWHPRVKMKEAINLEILEKFEKADIQMAFPTQTIELKK